MIRKNRYRPKSKYFCEGITKRTPIVEAVRKNPYTWKIKHLYNGSKSEMSDGIFKEFYERI